MKKKTGVCVRNIQNKKMNLMHLNQKPYLS